MTTTQGLAQGRKVQVAAKDHKCFAACGQNIPKGEYYIADTLMKASVVPSNRIMLMVTAWHLGCAPLTRAHARRELDDAIKNNAKHPTRTGAEYEDA